MDEEGAYADHQHQQHPYRAGDAVTCRSFGRRELKHAKGECRHRRKSVNLDDRIGPQQRFKAHCKTAFGIRNATRSQ
jgi:hypothetical protein